MWGSTRLHCWGNLHLSTIKFKVLEGILTNNKLRKNNLNGMSTHVPSLTTIDHFFYLKKIWIESPSFKNARKVVEYLTIPLKSLKKVYANIFKCDKEISLLSCILLSACFLQTMAITVPICFEYIHEQSFLNKFLGLQISFGEATLLIIENIEDHYKRCLCKYSWSMWSSRCNWRK